MNPQVAAAQPLNFLARDRSGQKVTVTFRRRGPSGGFAVTLKTCCKLYGRKDPFMGTPTSAAVKAIAAEPLTEPNWAPIR